MMMFVLLQSVSPVFSVAKGHAHELQLDSHRRTSSGEPETSHDQNL